MNSFSDFTMECQNFSYSDLIEKRRRIEKKFQFKDQKWKKKKLFYCCSLETFGGIL